MTTGLTPEFSVSYDRPTKVISAIACGVLVIAAAATYNLAVGCLALAIFGISFAYSPRGYTVSRDAITVRRWIGNATVPLDGLREVRELSKDDVRGCIRVWGSGGLFGYYGLFRTSRLGLSTWYVTNRKGMVVVRTAAKAVVFSPDDKEGFLSAVRETAPAGMVFTPEPFTGVPSSSRRSFGWWVGIVIAIAAGGFAAWAIYYSPGPPSYTLTSSSLTIHDRFYPVTVQASAVDIAHIRVVDFGDEPDWRPVVRTNGFANSHYRSGWFRAANGSTMRLYQANGRRLVLLPALGGGVPVLYQAKDPDAFVQEVTAAWTVNQ